MSLKNMHTRQKCSALHHKGTTSSLATRFTGINATLYGNGEAVAINRLGNAEIRGGASYLGKDVLGSVRSRSNEDGQLEDRYEYDAFGKPYKGDLNSGMNLGYTGKPYDTATGMYNYGYRDYQPEVARFTTEDPIRDGSNWFAYVNNDPVNYVDLWGLTTSEPKPHAAEPVITQGQWEYTSGQYFASKATVATPNIYTNSSNFSTFVPIDGPATGSPSVYGFFSATITTTVVVSPNSNTADVFSYTTRGPIHYDATAITTATATVNGVVYDSAQLTSQPAVLSDAYASLGGATLNIPSFGETTITTATTWTIPSDAGQWSPGTQTVSVPLK
jgi:RHS repeat-associated protein